MKKIILIFVVIILQNCPIISQNIAIVPCNTNYQFWDFAEPTIPLYLIGMKKNDLDSIKISFINSNSKYVRVDFNYNIVENSNNFLKVIYKFSPLPHGQYHIKLDYKNIISSEIPLFIYPKRLINKESINSYLSEQFYYSIPINFNLTDKIDCFDNPLNYSIEIINPSTDSTIINCKGLKMICFNNEIHHSYPNILIKINWKDPISGDVFNIYSNKYKMKTKPPNIIVNDIKYSFERIRKDRKILKLSNIRFLIQSNQLIANESIEENEIPDFIKSINPEDLLILEKFIENPDIINQFIELNENPFINNPNLINIIRDPENLLKAKKYILMLKNNNTKEHTKASYNNDYQFFVVIDKVIPKKNNKNYFLNEPMISQKFDDNSIEIEVDLDISSMKKSKEIYLDYIITLKSWSKNLRNGVKSEYVFTEVPINFSIKD